MALVLCTGVDPVLIETRRLVLEKAGHRVVTAMDTVEIIKACQKHKFEVAVIGQAITRQVKRHVMAVVRKHAPTAKVLELHRFPTGKVLEDADAWLEVPVDVPQELAERVTALAAGA